MPETAPGGTGDRALRYRSIVTFVDADPSSQGRLAAAIGLAGAEDAHLTAVALHYVPNIPPYAFSETPAGSMTQILVDTHEAAESRAGSAQEAIDAGGIRGDAVPCVTIYNDVERAVAEAARYADLAVTGPPEGPALPGTASDILDGVLFESDVPALVLPAEGTPPDPSTVLIGWDASRQALRAVRGALPFLGRAARVEICIFDPRGEAPGQRLATFLSRHGVHATIAALPRPRETTAAALARRALEIGAGLLVMGAYGHSRFRETLIGGVTRETLEDVPLPLLLAH